MWKVLEWNMFQGSSKKDWFGKEGFCKGEGLTVWTKEEVVWVWWLMVLKHGQSERQVRSSWQNLKCYGEGKGWRE